MKCIFSYTALAFIVAAGCGGPANKYDAVVTGTVTVDGELAKSGIVTFHPMADGKAAIGRIHPDGSYSLRTGQGDLREVDGGTVVPGEYIVTVSITGPRVENAEVSSGAPPISGPSLVAAKYASKETSDLKRTVMAGSQVIILDLERADTVPTAEVPPESAAAEREAATDASGADGNSATDEPAQPPSAETAPEAAPATNESGAKPSAEDSTP
jgi:hypothetical protein